MATPTRGLAFLGSKTPNGRFWIGKCDSGETLMNERRGMLRIVGRFCETPTERHLTQTPYNSPSARKSSRGSSKLQLPKDLTNFRRYRSRSMSIFHSRHTKKSSPSENE